MTRLCPRCHTDLTIKTSWFGFVKYYHPSCPTCRLNYITISDGTVWIKVGKYTTPDLEEAEQLAKEHGEEWPEWPKKAAPEDGSAK